MVASKKSVAELVNYYMGLPYTMIVKHYDEQGGYYLAGYLELPDLIMTGDTPEEAVKELLSEKPEWFEKCLELGLSIPEPQTRYSGNINIRVDPELHARLAMEAAAYNMSLNKYTSLVLERRRPGIIEGKPLIVREKPQKVYKAGRSNKKRGKHNLT